MANFYEHYQIPFDFNQVNNLYDHNYYDNDQQQQFGFDPIIVMITGMDLSVRQPLHLLLTLFLPCLSLNTCSTIRISTRPTNLLLSLGSIALFKASTSRNSTSTIRRHTVVATISLQPTGNLFLNRWIFVTLLQPLLRENLPLLRRLSILFLLEFMMVVKTKIVKKRVTFSEPLEEAKPLETIKEGENDHEEEEEEEDEAEEEDEDDEEEEYHSSSYGPTKPENVDKGEVKALYVPSGYGLEATDVCEVIFGGYFPCVLRKKRRQEDDNRAAEVSCWESTDSDPWKTTADYLFGDSYPYDYENRVERHQFEISSYGYQRYYRSYHQMCQSEVRATFFFDN